MDFPSPNPQQQQQQPNLNGPTSFGQQPPVQQNYPPPTTQPSSFPGIFLNKLTGSTGSQSDAPIDQGGDTISINGTSYPAKMYNGQRVAFKTRFLLSDQAYVLKATGDGYEWKNVKLDKGSDTLIQNGGRRRRSTKGRRLTKRRKSRKTRIGRRKRRSTTKRF